MLIECPICGGNLEGRGNNLYLYEDKCEIREKYFCPFCNKELDKFLTYELKLIDEEWRFHGDFKAKVKNVRKI